MAVTNLTNTTWFLEKDKWVARKGYGQFNVTGQRAQVGYGQREMTCFNIGYDYGNIAYEHEDMYYIYFGQHDDAMTSSASYVVTFTGGEDVTNISLISWLQSNGTMLPVTDLTNTTWNVPAGWTAEAGYGEFNVNARLVTNGVPQETITALNIGDKARFASSPYSWYVNVYTNSGDSLVFTIDSEIESTLTVTETGFKEYLHGYTYDGDKTFLGFATSANATSPVYTIGDSLTLEQEMIYNLYIVEGEPEEPTEYIEITYADKVFKLAAGQKITFKGGKVMQSDIGVKVVASEEIKLISFTTSYGTEYAEEGMTWYDWVNSDYNSGLHCDSITGIVYDNGLNGLSSVQGSQKWVYGSDTIVDGKTYYWVTFSND